MSVLSERVALMKARGLLLDPSDLFGKEVGQGSNPAYVTARSLGAGRLTSARFTAKFRRDAARAVRRALLKGESVRSVARRLRVNETTLRGWCR